MLRGINGTIALALIGAVIISTGSGMVMMWLLLKYRRPTVGRNIRQHLVHQWCEETFGWSHAYNKRTRALRFLEEAIELYQAMDGDIPTAKNLLEYVFRNKPGDIRQEMGGVGITLLALGQMMGISADNAEADEFVRVQAKSKEHFQARNQVKVDAGFGG